MEKAVARYAGDKGNLKFPIGQPIPYDLIERIVKFKVKQNSTKALASHKSKRAVKIFETGEHSRTQADDEEMTWITH